MNPSATDLDFISLQVRDLEASARFYMETLLFERGRSPNEHAVVFKTQAGAIFAVRTPLMDFSGISMRGAGASLWFRVEDSDALFAHVKKMGARVLKPIEDGPFGRVFVVADPDGYALTIHGK